LIGVKLGSSPYHEIGCLSAGILPIIMRPAFHELFFDGDKNYTYVNSRITYNEYMILYFYAWQVLLQN
jgi:hypothetical protein